MAERYFSVDEIKELIDAVKTSDIEKLSISQDDFSIEIEGKSKVQMVQMPITGIAQESMGQPERTVAGTIDTPPAKPSGNMVKSPIVGTFYQSPSPEKPPYVKVGEQVKKGDILFIIESMKLMNEVLSEYAGTVTAIHVEDGQVVEYGQAILTIE